jgi:hypothetical protein
MANGSASDVWRVGQGKSAAFTKMKRGDCLTRERQSGISEQGLRKTRENGRSALLAGWDADSYA